MAEPADFEQLRQKRLRYVDSARENDFEEGLKSLLSELYPDNAHFIYELLQNAEDALATTIEFTLGEDRLTVTHNGQRPFSLEDIESITGIGNSTKKDDPTQIGKFGVGFKAVFAYTSRPEIRSGQYSFAIEDLFVPTWIDGTSRPGLTSFTFPFDRHDKPVDVARAEIERGLSQLDEKTLLFLNCISSITYGLPDGGVGIIERQAVDERVIRITKAEGDDFVESLWLRLTGPATVSVAGDRALTVAAAFQLEAADAPPSKRDPRPDADGLDQTRLSIVPVEKGDVSLYFPAIKESSGLYFHIHAPFASTVGRDSVRDDQGNIQLIDDIASAIVGALPQLRDQGLINDSLLGTLPNDEDPIGHPYNRIRRAVTEAFNDLELTPVWGSTVEYADARSLISSPSEFRNRLEPRDLPVLFELAEIEVEQSPRWIRDREGREGTFLAGLDTIEFGWDELAGCLHNAQDVGDADDPFIPGWIAWLEAKSDARIVDLYRLIGHGLTNYEFGSGGLTAVPIIRLRRRGGTEHVLGPETYLPSSRSDTARSRVPIDLAYFDDDDDLTRTRHLKAFYTAAGVKRWNESAKIDKRLASYDGSATPIPEGDALARHLEDVRSFARFAATDRQSARQRFSNAPFLLAAQSDGSSQWVTPQRTFLDVPFRDTGLSALYPRVALYWKKDGLFAHDREPYPLSGLYLEVEGIAEFMELVGARVGVEITKADVTENPQFVYTWRYSNRENSNGLRVDWGIERLQDLLDSGDPDLLRSLWHTVVTASTDKATAVYQANGSSTRHPMESQLAQTLKTTPWVLDRDGNLKTPRQVTIEDLRDDWQHPGPTSLVHRLDFGVEATRRRQKRDGVSDFLREEGLDPEIIELAREAKEAGVSMGELRTAMRELAESAEFPGGPSHDADRRAAVAAQDAARAPTHTTQMRERSIVESQSQAAAESKAYLRGHYTDAAGSMFCQACQKPLPFKTKDSMWYFEAVRFVNARRYVHTANAIALCPLCAALYKYARETTNEALLDQVTNMAIDDAQGTVDVPVVLNGRRITIMFTGKHAIDIRAALRVAGNSRDADVDDESAAFIQSLLDGE